MTADPSASSFTGLAQPLGSTIPFVTAGEMLPHVFAALPNACLLLTPRAAHCGGKQRQAQVATEQQREQLYQAFEQTPVAIAIMRGHNLRAELANAAVAAIWGREPAQVLGRPYFEAVPDAAGQGFEQILSNMLTTGTPFTITEVPVTLARAHVGLPTQAFVNFVFQPLRDADGTTVGLIASGTEVTEQTLGTPLFTLLPEIVGQ